MFIPTKYSERIEEDPFKNQKINSPNENNNPPIILIYLAELEINIYNFDKTCSITIINVKEY